jgi:ubiquinone/menaquinone biosynthesis C-methylase UbiE
MSGSLQHYDPRRTYDTVAEDYDRTSVDFWRYSVPATIRRAAPRPGDRVLDVACGPGPAAIAAAEAVGPAGRVVGVDISPEMVGLARAHARERNLRNVRFEVGSMDASPVWPGEYEVVTCIFGLFFALDIGATLASLRGSLAPGGRLAVTTLGRKFFSPLYQAFVEAAVYENPAIDTDVPWRRTQDPDEMRRLLAGAGFPGARVDLEVSRLPLARPEDWWRIVTGTGIRRLAMDLDPDALDRVREHNLQWIVDHGVDEVELGVIYAVAEVDQAVTTSGRG